MPDREQSKPSWTVGILTPTSAGSLGDQAMVDAATSHLADELGRRVVIGPNMFATRSCAHGARNPGKLPVLATLAGMVLRARHVGLIGAAYLALVVTLAANGGPWWAILGLISAPLALRPASAVLTRTDGAALNGALAGTGALLGAFSLATSAGLLIAA